MDKLLEILGKKVKDKITDFEGIAEGVVFDLYGCLQVQVRPKIPNNELEKAKATWFDWHRLIIVDQNPIMTRPTFSNYLGGNPEPQGPAEHAESSTYADR